MGGELSEVARTRRELEEILKDVPVSARIPPVVALGIRLLTLQNRVARHERKLSEMREERRRSDSGGRRQGETPPMSEYGRPGDWPV